MEIVTNRFHTFILNVDPDLAAEIPNHLTDMFKDPIKTNPRTNVFTPANEQELIGIVQIYKNNHHCTDMSLVKKVLNPISKPIYIYICHLSVQTGCVSN